MLSICGYPFLEARTNADHTTLYGTTTCTYSGTSYVSQQIFYMCPQTVWGVR